MFGKLIDKYYGEGSEWQIREEEEVKLGELKFEEVRYGKLACYVIIICNTACACDMFYYDHANTHSSCT